MTSNTSLIKTTPSKLAREWFSVKGTEARLISQPLILGQLEPKQNSLVATCASMIQFGTDFYEENHNRDKKKDERRTRTRTRTSEYET